MLRVIPINLRDANAFVAEHHRHAQPPRGCKYSIGALAAERLVGVAIVGRPVSRLMQDGLTAEVTRVCVLDDAPKGTCSFLYGRSWRIWQQMGGERMITYTLQAESGSSLRGAGWKIAGERRGRGSSSWQRPDAARDFLEVYEQPKFRWEAA